MADAELQIAQRLPCLGCGYDLRSLGLDRVCPECGRPVAESLDHLLLCPESHLRRIRTGALLAGIASMSAPIGVALGTGTYAVLRTTGTGRSDASNTSVSVAAVVVLGIGPLLGLLGWSRLRYSSPPIVLPDGRVHTPAQAVWGWTAMPLSMAMLLASWALLAMLANEALSGTATLGLAEEEWMLIVVAVGAIWALRMAAGMRLLGDLTRRAGRPREARSSAFWSIVCGCAIAAAFAGFALHTRLLELPVDILGLGGEDIGTLLLIAWFGAAAAVSLGNFVLQQVLMVSTRRIMRAIRTRRGPVLVLVGDGDAAADSGTTASSEESNDPPMEPRHARGEESNL
ncbi:MAG: hypothetical protein ACK4WH_12885 [Phycisphaerales bacterium]